MKKYFNCFGALICASIVIFTSCNNDNSNEGNNLFANERLVSEIVCYYQDEYESFRVLFEYNDNNQVDRVLYFEEGDCEEVQDFFYYSDHIRVSYEDGYYVDVWLNDKGYVSNVTEEDFEDYYEYDSNDRLSKVIVYAYDEVEYFTRFSWFDENVISVVDTGGDIYEMEYNQYDHSRINIDLNNFIAMYVLDSDYDGFWEVWPLKVAGKVSKNYMVSQFMDWEDGQQISKLDWTFVGRYPTKCCISVITKYDEDEDGVFDEINEYDDVLTIYIKYCD